MLRIYIYIMLCLYIYIHHVVYIYIVDLRICTYVYHRGYTLLIHIISWSNSDASHLENQIGPSKRCPSILHQDFQLPPHLDFAPTHQQPLKSSELLPNFRFFKRRTKNGGFARIDFSRSTPSVWWNSCFQLILNPPLQIRMIHIGNRCVTMLFPSFSHFPMFFFINFAKNCQALYIISLCPQKVIRGNPQTFGRGLSFGRFRISTDTWKITQCKKTCDKNLVDFKI